MFPRLRPERGDNKNVLEKLLMKETTAFLKLLVLIYF